MHRWQLNSLWARAAAALLLATLVFIFDLHLPGQLPLAVLYVLVLLALAPALSARQVLAVGVGCSLLTLLAFATKHGPETFDQLPTILTIGCLSLIALTTHVIAARQQALGSQRPPVAVPADGNQPAIIIHTLIDGTWQITYWNGAASERYGWQRGEVLGKSAQSLLHASHPQALALLRRLQQEGRWRGPLQLRHRTGRPLAVFSRLWLEHHAHNGQALIVQMDTSAADDQPLPSSHALLDVAMRDHALLTIRQPLTSIVLDSHAGLLWLDRTVPDLEAAQQAFLRIASSALRIHSMNERQLAFADKYPATTSLEELLQATRAAFAARPNPLQIVWPSQITIPSVIIQGELSAWRQVLQTLLLIPEQHAKEPLVRLSMACSPTPITDTDATLLLTMQSDAASADDWRVALAGSRNDIQALGGRLDWQQTTPTSFQCRMQFPHATSAQDISPTSLWVALGQFLDTTADGLSTTADASTTVAHLDAALPCVQAASLAP